RAAIITFLWRLDGATLNYANYWNPFSDVDGTNQFYPAIMWGYHTGIIGGFEQADGTLEFRPWDNCNRAAIVTFLYRYAKNCNNHQDVITDEIYTLYGTKFKDMTNNSEFNRAIAWAVWEGITTGWDDGTFRPWNTCNRAAAMSFLYRYATMPAG
ncbi:MAG: S-layer homology domain-containing protein, partial [Lachnospiraceae bacterium]|nr:S-layer homology domain-containing protein [Lachnospiraceae bacterium]